MGLVYAPQSIGKGATSGNFRGFNPKLAGGYSRTGAIIQGLYTGYRFVKANYKLFTGIGSVVTGAGVENLVGTSNNKLSETYSPKNFSQRGGRYSQKFNTRSSNIKYKHPRRCSNRCCCESCVRRTMVRRRRGSRRY